MKMLKMRVLLGDVKASKFFTKEHIKVLQVITTHLTLKITTPFTISMIMITIMTALMSMMTTRGAIMLMMLMTMMMQWQMKITMAYTHA